MKRVLLIFGLLALIGLSSCWKGDTDKVLMDRDFPTASWERFDFVQRTIVLDKPVTYDLDLDVWFDDNYAFNYFSAVFTVFDSEGNPLRARDYRFTIKDRNGAWKSQVEDGAYHFRFPINSELSLNEPGTYVLQFENHMPITPLYGIRKLSIVKN